MLNFRQLIAATVLVSCAFSAHAERLKDIASISGVRTNQLIGYGLVVGLNGTGDQTTQTPFTLQTSTTCSRSSASRCRQARVTCS